MSSYSRSTESRWGEVAAPATDDAAVNCDLAARIDAVCDRFEGDWRAGRQPRLENCLAAVGSGERVPLFRALLAVELELLRAEGMAPTPADYHRFPDLAAEVDKVFAATGALATTALGHDGGDAAESEGAAPLPAIPGYEIEAELGRGGMGVVYQALDSAFGRNVAVKLMQQRYAGQASARRRFLEEAQITGQLQHPGIPPVHELGELPDGRPFLAMKLIQGRTLQALLEGDGCGPGGEAKTQTRPQSFGKFIGIFEGICQALAYAHSRSVIHRDLKPHNVMVGAFGEVQVMDWGLAKVVGSDAQRSVDDPLQTEATTCAANTRELDMTQPGSVLGTPAFMAPEQAAGQVGQVDRRSDVFGLGAILCSILTGAPPYRGGSAVQLCRAASLGELADAFERLEQSGAEPEIVLLCKRCLAVKPEDRPQDAGELAAAVAAIRTQAEERARHAEMATAEALVREVEGRHRRRVWVGLAAALVVGLAATAAVALWAVNAERQARAEAEFANQVKDFLQFDVLQLADPKTQAEDRELPYDADVKLREVVLRAAKAIEGKFSDRPLVEAELRGTLGVTLLGMGRTGLAAIQFERACDLYARCCGSDDPRTLGSMNNLAGTYDELGRLHEALKLREKTLALMRARLGPDHIDTLQSMLGLANSYAALGRYAEALRLREESMRVMKSTLGSAHPSTLSSMHNLASTYSELGRYAEALKLREETLELSKTNLAPDHPDTLTSMSNLANGYAELGRYSEAVTLLETTIALMKTKLGPDHPDTLTCMENLASGYAAMGRHPESLKLREESLRLMRNTLGPAHPHTLSNVHNLAINYAMLSRTAEALKLFEETLATRIAKLGPNHPDTLRTMGNLASSYAGLGWHAKALKLREETLKFLKAELGLDHPDTLNGMHHLAESYAALGRLTESLKLYVETLSRREVTLGPDHPDTLRCMSDLALIHAALDSRAEALRLHEKMFALSNSKLGSDHPVTLSGMSGLALSYAACGRDSEALKLREAILAARMRQLGPDHSHTLESMNNVANSCSSLGRHAEAQKLYVQIIEALEARLTRNPNEGGSIVTLAGACCNLGSSLRQVGKPAEALRRFAQGQAYLEPLLAKEPDAFEVRDFLRITHANRAVAFEQLRRFAEADADWAKAIELSTTHERTDLRADEAEWKAKRSALPPKPPGR